MNKRELAENVAEDTGLQMSQSEAAVGAVLDAIASTLAAGDGVTLAGFGTFEVRERAARTGRNPQTGEALEIAATVAPAFKPAAALKRQVAGA